MSQNNISSMQQQNSASQRQSSQDMNARPTIAQPIKESGKLYARLGRIQQMIGKGGTPNKHSRTSHNRLNFNQRPKSSANGSHGNQVFSQTFSPGSTTIVNQLQLQRQTTEADEVADVADESGYVVTTNDIEPLSNRHAHNSAYRMQEEPYTESVPPKAARTPSRSDQNMSLSFSAQSRPIGGTTHTPDQSFISSPSYAEESKTNMNLPHYQNYLQGPGAGCDTSYSYNRTNNNDQDAMLSSDSSIRHRQPIDQPTLGLATVNQRMKKHASQPPQANKKFMVKQQLSYKNEADITDSDITTINQVSGLAKNGQVQAIVEPGTQVRQNIRTVQFDLSNNEEQKSSPRIAIADSNFSECVTDINQDTRKAQEMTGTKELPGFERATSYIHTSTQKEVRQTSQQQEQESRSSQNNNQRTPSRQNDHFYTSAGSQSPLDSPSFLNQQHPPYQQRISEIKDLVSSLQTGEVLRVGDRTFEVDANLLDLLQNLEIKNINEERKDATLTLNISENNETPTPAANSLQDPPSFLPNEIMNDNAGTQVLNRPEQQLMQQRLDPVDRQMSFAPTNLLVGNQIIDSGVSQFNDANDDDGNSLQSQSIASPPMLVETQRQDQQQELEITNDPTIIKNDEAFFMQQEIGSPTTSVIQALNSPKKADDQTEDDDDFFAKMMNEMQVDLPTENLAPIAKQSSSIYQMQDLFTIRPSVPNPMSPFKKAETISPNTSELNTAAQEEQNRYTAPQQFSVQNHRDMPQASTDKKPFQRSNSDFDKDSTNSNQAHSEEQKLQSYARNNHQGSFEIQPQQLHRIEEQKHESVSNNNVLDESQTVSNFTQSFIGGRKPVEFGSGDMRENRVRLVYLEPNHNNLGHTDGPEAYGNPLIDQIGTFAYIHGLDPNILCEENDEAALEHITKLKKELQPPSLRRNQQQAITEMPNQHSIPDIVSRDIVDTRRLLHTGPSTHQYFEDSTDHYQPNGAFQQPQQTQRRRQTVQNGNRNNRRSLQTSNSFGLNETSRGWIDNEVIKNKAQIQVLSIAFKRYLSEQDRQKVKQINQQIRILQQHETKLQEIVDMFKVFKKELHFAFLFASPLFFKHTVDKFMSFPQLNFTKEFVKIKDSIAAAKVQINITKRQCTTDSLQEVLAQKPLGLHFSGHGLLNNDKIGKEFHEKYKDQGDFLVLENDKGGSELVSRNQLKKMIRQNKCELDFVFVATCHSEFVGRIFLQAGAKHVICIDQQNEVKDDAVLCFTGLFYRMLFEQNKEICQAFQQAQLNVEINYGEKEAGIFKLLTKQVVSNDDKHNRLSNDSRPAVVVDQDKTFRSSGMLSHAQTQELHKCSTFGPFQMGQYNYVNHQIVQLQNKAPKMPNLRGRQKDMFRVIEKILDSKNSRLFNLCGWPGIGKSALVASILDYISERRLLRGGSIYFNARNISICEVFIRNFNQVLISENPTLFGTMREKEQIKHEPIKNLVSILDKLSIIDGDIVMVIDNAEMLIEQERNDFSILISMMLTRVSQLKILLTSQRQLQTSNLEFKEEKIYLSNLGKVQSLNLFKEVMARDLHQQEINDLTDMKPDLKKYPEEKYKNLHNKLEEHHLFTLLDGIPQSIILVASLLADHQKKCTLKEVYQMLTDIDLSELLKNEGINETDKISRRISSQIAFQAIEDDPETIDFLNLLSLLPGGLNPQDLDFLWNQLAQVNRKNQLEAKQGNQNEQFSQAGSQRSRVQAEVFRVNQTQGAWRRAFAELKKLSLAEERKAYRRSYNTKDEPIKQSETVQSSEHLTQQTEEKVDADIVIVLPEIVRNFAEVKMDDNDRDFFLEILSNWYYEQLLEIYRKNENIVLSANQKQKEQMIREFERLEENLNMYMDMQEDFLKQRSQGFDITGSDSSSDEEGEGESYAETMFGDRSITKSQIHLPESGQPDTLRVKSMEFSDAINEQTEKADSETNYPELKEAYLNLKQRKPALEKYLDMMKPKQVQHPKQILDREEKAKGYWRWAFEKIKTQMMDKIQIENVKIDGNEDLEESFDSDHEEPDLPQFEESKENKTDFIRMQSRRRIRESFCQNKQSKLSLNFQRGSIKKTQRPTSFYARQQSRLSVYAIRRKTQVQVTQFYELQTEEKTLIYYLVNLILFQQYNVANSLIKRHYTRMKQCSDLFKGNVRRFQAVSMLRVLQNDNNPSKKSGPTLTEKEKQVQAKKIDSCLVRAERNFKKAQSCAWGLALTYYTKAIFKLYLIQQLIESPQYETGQAKSQAGDLNEPNGLALQVEDLFDKAIEEFKKVNHLRGLYNVHKHQSNFTEIALQRKLSTVSICKLKRSDRKNPQMAKYKEYLNAYDVQKLSDFIDSDLTITRSSGDDLSLMTEVVLNSSNKILFQNETTVCDVDSQSENSLVTSNGLRTVEENENNEQSSLNIPIFSNQQSDSCSIENIKLAGLKQGDSRPSIESQDNSRTLSRSSTHQQPGGFMISVEPLGGNISSQSPMFAKTNSMPQKQESMDHLKPGYQTTKNAKKHSRADLDMTGVQTGKASVNTTEERKK